MDIVIIADFCGELDGRDNNRFTYLAELLCQDNAVEIVTSDFDHSRKEYFKSEPKNFSYKVTMLHEGNYKKNVCLQRFQAHYMWGINVAKYLNERKKPDVIYCAIPTLKAAYEAAQYCEKNQIRFVIDIQDLWPEAFQMVFNVPFLNNLIFTPFKYLADGVYKRADKICAVSQTYVDRALRVNKKTNFGYSVFLGTRLSTFDENVRNNLVSRENNNELWLAYCGTLGNSYDLVCVMEALSVLNEKHNLKFIIMGDGPRRNEFEISAKRNNISCLFTGKLPYSQMCGLLSSCDIVVNPIKHGAAASIINKHADYAASGLPVVNTQESSEYRTLVEQYKMGFNCESNDVHDLAEKIDILCSNVEMRKKMGKNARKCAEECFDREKSYACLIRQITYCEIGS